MHKTAAVVLDPLHMVTGLPAVELGPFNMAPWNITSFNDVAAKWIWSRSGADTVASNGLYTTFWKTLVIPAATNATLYMLVDDTAEVAVNSAVVAVLTIRWMGIFCSLRAVKYELR